MSLATSTSSPWIWWPMVSIRGFNHVARIGNATQRCECTEENAIANVSS